VTTSKKKGELLAPLRAIPITLAYLGDPTTYGIKPTVSACDAVATDDREVVVASLFKRHLIVREGVPDYRVAFAQVAFALYATAVAAGYDSHDFAAVYCVSAVLVLVGDLGVASSAVHLGLPVASTAFVSL
jgi:hypothetical protein